MTRLHELYDRFGQSVWLDNLERRWLASGELARRLEEGVRGITSNPTIFAKAMAGSDAYDEQIRDVARDGAGGRRGVLAAGGRRTWAQPPTCSGRSSTPRAASTATCRSRSTPRWPPDTEETVAAARRLYAALARPNVFIKVPATPEGVPAIRRLIGAGINVNVTLIFSLERHREVMEAYLSGLEDLRAGGGDARLGGVGRQLLRQPGRQRGRSSPRRHRQRRGAGPAGQGGDRPGAGRLPELPGDVRRPPLGRSRRRRRPACSDRCGHPRPRRTRTIPTRCTSTS